MGCTRTMLAIKSWLPWRRRRFKLLWRITKPYKLHAAISCWRPMKNRAAIASGQDTSPSCCVRNEGGYFVIATEDSPLYTIVHYPKRLGYDKLSACPQS